MTLYWITQSAVQKDVCSSSKVQHCKGKNFPGPLTLRRDHNTAVRASLVTQQ